MTVVLMLLLGGAGALVRAEATARRGVRRGTAVVNLAGAFLLGLVVGLVGGTGVDSGWVLVLGTGFCGGLTTFSTWLLDTTERPERDQVVAVVATAFAGMLLAAVGWFLGALL